MTEVYEWFQATRYNYSDAEKLAIAELIGLIKGVQCLVKRQLIHMQRSVNVHLYSELQEFIKVALSEPLEKATKNHKDIIAG